MGVPARAPPPGDLAAVLPCLLDDLDARPRSDDRGRVHGAGALRSRRRLLHRRRPAFWAAPATSSPASTSARCSASCWRNWWPAPAKATDGAGFDLVEAGRRQWAPDAGRAGRASSPASRVLYAALRVTLVERSPRARAQHESLAAEHATLPFSSRDTLPAAFAGPAVRQRTARRAAGASSRPDATPGCARPTCVAEGDHLLLESGPVSSETLASYLDGRRGRRCRPVPPWTSVPPPWRGRATRRARLQRGALLFIDYGHEAATLFSGHHLRGTLVSYAPPPARCVPAPVTDGPVRPAWLRDAGHSAT